ncbi:G-type lectin S-receptor-like serine/threonine-protein kinase At2g19130 [Cryptomeria japonica]|uniref:G-type lectin S-receptor-like serine/threonine-protein kinase At2g19130 n=1 Tax=Cryptomeria japonica TaxID=3369 RepID=UPI0027DA76D8|nr:G-type lectin S-receptor-like serine/threonine-protein kinase At2g19130 [Cryptomeria japonica]
MKYVLKGQISISLRDLALTLILLICSSGVYAFAITADETGTIGLGSSVRRDQKWLSSDGMFAMGIFSLKEGTNYLGIWYAKITSPMRSRIIWVSNRDNPASNSASVQFRLDGNLLLLDQGKQIWSSNTSRLNVSFARLDKTGNFLLISRHNSSSDGAVAVWESFGMPCDTLIPGMKLRFGSKLTSWKDSKDPAPGPYSVIVDKDFVLGLYWNSTVAYWTSGDFDNSSSTFSNMQFLRRVNKRYNQINLIFSSGKLVLFWNSTEFYERIVVSHRG